MTYQAWVKVGSFEWTFTEDPDGGGAADDITVLMGLTFGWAMPGPLWPRQPDPMAASFNVNVPDFVDWGGGAAEGDSVAIEVKADVDDDFVIARFYGDVTDYHAIPRSDSAGVTLSVVAVDYMVRLKEEYRPAYVVIDDGTPTTDEELVDFMWADGDLTGLGEHGSGVTFSPPPRTLSDTYLVPGLPIQTPVADLVAQVLDGATDDGVVGIYRHILSPIVVPETDPDHHGLRVDGVVVGSITGAFYTLDMVYADPDALPVIWRLPAGAVGMDELDWSNVKGRTLGYVTTQGFGGDPANSTVSYVAGSPSITGANLPVLIQDEVNAQSVGDWYAARAGFDAWQVDKIVVPVTRFLANGGDLANDVVVLFPDWTLEPDDPYRSVCYSTGIHISDVDATRTPDGEDFIEGILVGAQCTIGQGGLVLEAALRRTPIVETEPPDPPSASRTITIPSGTVGSMLTRFPVRLDLHDITEDDWWDAVTSDGGNLRITDDTATDVPIDITYIDTATKQGELFFLGLLNDAADNVFTLTAVPGATAVPVTDANGRNGTWGDYEAVVIPSSVDGLIDRTDGAALTVVGTPDIGPSGLTIDALNEGFAAAAVSKLTAWSCGAHTRVSSSITANRTMLAYTGDSAYKAEVLADSPLWADLLEQTSGTSLNGDYSGNGRGGTIDAGVTFSTAPAGAAAFTKAWQLNAFEGGEVTAGSWMAPGSPAHTAEIWCYLTSYDPDGSVLLARSDVASGNNKSAKVWAIQVTGTGAVTGRTFSDTGATGTSIAPASAAGAVPLNTVCHVATTWDGTTVRFYVNGTQVASGALNGNYVPFGNNGKPITVGKSHNASGISNIYTVNGKIWGAGFYGTTLSGTRLTAHYNTGLAAAREALGVHDAATDKVGAWNSSDGWLDGATFASGDVGTLFRDNLVHDGTTDRKVYRNGALTGTDTGAATRPTGAGDTLLLGAESINAAEPWRGDLDFIYLRNGALTADWIAAEDSSWRSPSGFYTITIP